MCFKNQALFYKCRKLKNLGRLSALWFFNDTLVKIVKIEENRPISKTYYHVSHLEKLLKVDNIEELMFYQLTYEAIMVKFLFSGLRF